MNKQKRVYKRSYKNMGKLMYNFRSRLKHTPEEKVEIRERMIRKIELLKIIRGEMRILMKQMEA